MKIALCCAHVLLPTFRRWDWLALYNLLPGKWSIKSLSNFRKLYVGVSLMCVCVLLCASHAHKSKCVCVCGRRTWTWGLDKFLCTELSTWWRRQRTRCNHHYHVLYLSLQSSSLSSSLSLSLSLSCVSHLAHAVYRLSLFKAHHLSSETFNFNLIYAHTAAATAAAPVDVRTPSPPLPCCHAAP